MFCAENISYRAGRKNILSDCSIAVTPGAFTVVAGPNGAGKTSLLKILAHELTRYKGRITLNDRKITAINSRELSSLRAVLPQHTEVNFPFTVEQIVEIGRYPHRTTKLQNQRIIHEVLQLTDLDAFRTRLYQTLSGGEKQRVQMARVMAQVWDEDDQPKYLLLDEPTSSLDLAQQHVLLGLSKKLCQRNIGIMAVLHDLNLAAQYADDVLFLKEGQTIAFGGVLETMTRDIIEKTFSHPVRVTCDEDTNRPMICAIAGGVAAAEKTTIKQYAL